MQLDGNTILITGGGSGIGRGLAEAFVRLGNRVVITGRHRGKLEETVAAHPGIEAMVLDVTDPTAIRRFADEVTERYPSLDGLINNAGIMRGEDVTRGAVDDAEVTVTTNLLGPIRLTAALLPHLLARPRATVINVSSGLAFVPMAATPTYCATKAGLHAYSVALREQLAGTSVEVIEIVPPYVQTQLTGDHHASDPRAMPLADYIAETMAILRDEPNASEVIIDRVAGLRHAEARGTFEESLRFLTDLGRERSWDQTS
ncbi:MAG: SDR family oxidoreductase [Planctomycetes bacterium]|nr:SDR family oxidoreductase [Planctomycetota bacterium]